MASKPDRQTGRKFFQHPVTVLLLIVVLGGVIYANTFDAPFIFDDTPNILKNQYIQITEITPAALLQMVAEGPGPSASRPLSMFTFALNYFFHGYHPAGYHLVNLLLHLLNAFLLFLLSRHTLRLCRIESPAAPVFTALLWLAHPLHIQSVTYIVQRMTALATLFYLLALLFFIQGRLRLCERERWSGGTYLWFLASTVSGLLALFCKPIAGTLPVTIFFYEWYFFHHLQIDWIRRRIRWVLLSLTLFAVIAATYLHLIPLEKVLALYHSQHFVMDQRILTEMRVILYYLSLLCFPHPARLNLDYDFPLSFSLLQPPVTLLSLIALILLICAAILSTRKHRLLSFAILWFLIHLVIESSLIGLALIYEHRTYLPSIFPFVAAIPFFLQQSRPRPIPAAILCILILLSGAWTFQRNNVWRTELSLWQDCVNKSPQKAGPRNNLGLAWIRAGDYTRAIRQHQTTLTIRFRQLGAAHPDTAASYTNLGGAYRHMERYAEAIACHRKALGIREHVLGPEHPLTAECYNNLGVAYKNKGDYDQAILCYRRALTISRKRSGPDHINTAVIYHNLKNLYRRNIVPSAP